MKLLKMGFKIALIAVALFPITGAIQIFSGGDISAYDDYVKLMDSVYPYITEHLDWAFIIFTSLFLLGRKDEVKYRYQEEIRKRQYFFEYKRWSSTPFIPPILYYYLMSPPESFSPYKKDRAHNDFYPLILRDFRDRVTMDANFSSDEPDQRVSVLRVIGLKIFGVLGLHALTLFVIAFFALSSSQDFLHVFTQTNAKYLIPIILHLMGYILMMLFALKVASWKLLDNKLTMYFKEDYLHHEPRIPWVGMLPDTDAGYGVEMMWERDCMRRIRLTYELKGWSFPSNNEEIQWINPSIDNKGPFDGLDMSWVDETRKYVKAIKTKWEVEYNTEAVKAIQETRDHEIGQVVAFHKKN
ncbi:hypothetical protein QTG56_23795 (plasmid) [Rossellomorea sp. AcN35-11]|nr:hypothetical protein [Rossellomorea aquimaris]WJV32385.1 hypothetical protein QTG56_23795 [Rossellomorea sp. AcN35-11]